QATSRPRRNWCRSWRSAPVVASSSATRRDIDGGGALVKPGLQKQGQRPGLDNCRCRSAGECVEEVALHGGKVVGEDRARAVDVVEDAVGGGAGAGVGGAAEELLLHLRKVGRQDG